MGDGFKSKQSNSVFEVDFNGLGLDGRGCYLYPYWFRGVYEKKAGFKPPISQGLPWIRDG